MTTGVLSFRRTSQYNTGESRVGIGGAENEVVHKQSATQLQTPLTFKSSHYIDYYTGWYTLETT